MKLKEMLSKFPNRDQRNEMLMNLVFSHITPPMIVDLLQHGIEPNSFASGINFVFQHLAQNGLPEDWEEVVHPVDPDPAKNSKVALTEEDGKEISIGVEDYLIAFQKARKLPEPPRDRLEGSGF